MNEQQKEKDFYKIFAENKNKIFRLCFGSIRNKEDVDDLFQEVMINVWNNLEKFRGDSSISTWIYRITVNTAILFNKKHSAKKVLVNNLEFSELDNVKGLFNKPDERLEKLHLCISRLDTQNRVIVSLLLEGFSYEEISDFTGISVNYVGVKINRIKQTLGKCILEKNNE